MNAKKTFESNIEYFIKSAMQKHQAGQFDEAELIYKQILETQTDNEDQKTSLGDLFYSIVLNLGDVLQNQGKSKEAIKVYQQALIFDPNFAEAHNNLGNIFQEQGKLEAAVECYQQALKIKPGLDHIHNNLGNILKRYNLEAAIQSYQQAIKVNPDCIDAHYNLGSALNEQNQLEAAVVAYQQALNIQPDFAASRFAICMTQLPIIYFNVDEIQFRRNQYQHQLHSLANYYQFANTKERVEAAKMIGFSQPFYLAYQGFNDRPLQEIYGKMICQLMASRYPRWNQITSVPNLKADDKVRVGFVSGYFREHSCWKLIKGWVENLDRSEFELFGYHTETKRDRETVRAAKAFDKFTQGPLLLEQWAEVIAQDNLHILIFPEFGMDSMTVRLGCLRLAPIQIGSWIHPETSGMPTIDYFLTSDLMEPENAQDHYTEKLVRLPNLSIYYTPLDIEPKAIAKSDIGIADNQIMFWCCQSIFKYLPQHDNVFPRIAKKLANSKFVFIEHHISGQVTEVFRQRLSRAFEEFELNYQDYCIFLPQMESTVFAGTAAIADVFLDSIGWSGGNTTLEAIAHNIPVVTFPGDLMRGRHTMAMLKMMGMEETIAASKEEYVQIAVRLGEDAQYRQYISQEVGKNKQQLYGDLKPVRSLEDFLLKLVNKTRRFGTKELSEALQLAVEHQRTHRFTEAEQLYRQVLEKQPHHPEALYGLGMLAMGMEQTETAEQCLSAASQVQPDSVRIWFSLGNLRFSQGQLPKAENAYQHAIALRPDAVPIYNNLGYTLQQQGKFDEAIAYYQKALEIEPNCTEADVNWGNALHAQGKLSDDKQDYYAQLNHKLGLSRKGAGDMKMAVAYYKQAIAIQPDFLDAHYNLGVVLQQLDEFKEAIACYQTALELNPQHHQADISLGQILRSNGIHVET
jgi:protein O-GlcNAc transferase